MIDLEYIRHSLLNSTRMQILSLNPNWLSASMLIKNFRETPEEINGRIKVFFDREITAAIAAAKGDKTKAIENVSSVLKSKVSIMLNDAGVVTYAIHENYLNELDITPSTNISALAKGRRLETDISWAEACRILKVSYNAFIENEIRVHLKSLPASEEYYYTYASNGLHEYVTEKGFLEAKNTAEKILRSRAISGTWVIGGKEHDFPSTSPVLELAWEVFKAANRDNLQAVIRPTKKIRCIRTSAEEAFKETLELCVKLAEKKRWPIDRDKFISEPWLVDSKYYLIQEECVLKLIAELILRHQDKSSDYLILHNGKYDKAYLTAKGNLEVRNIMAEGEGKIPLIKITKAHPKYKSHEGLYIEHLWSGANSKYTKEMVEQVEAGIESKYGLLASLLIDKEAGMLTPEGYKFFEKALSNLAAEEASVENLAAEKQEQIVDVPHEAVPENQEVKVFPTIIEHAVAEKIAAFIKRAAAAKLQ